MLASTPTRVDGGAVFCINCLAACLLATLFVTQIVTPEQLVYNEFQCQDVCLRNSSCQTYNIGPVQANGKRECFLNPQNGKKLDLKDVCLRNSSCQTYNIGPVQANGKRECFLNPQNGKQLDLKDQLITACGPNVCEHGGDCFEDNTACRRMYCSCKKNWTGPNCGIKVKDVNEGRATVPKCPAH